MYKRQCRLRLSSSGFCSRDTSRLISSPLRSSPRVAVLTGVPRRSLSRDVYKRQDVHFVGDAEAVKDLGGLLNSGQIAVAAHYQTDFFHSLPPKK